MDILNQAGDLLFQISEGWEPIFGDRHLLAGANLKGARLPGFDLGNANLSRACLIGADLYQAFLNLTDLSHADMEGANLRGCDLEDANLTFANHLRFNDDVSRRVRSAVLGNAYFRRVSEDDR
jgi:uncharacterized protein YjbI with pentapeptide repeats